MFEGRVACMQHDFLLLVGQKNYIFLRKKLDVGIVGIYENLEQDG